MTEDSIPSKTDRRRQPERWRRDAPELLELRQEISELRRANTQRDPRQPRSSAGRSAPRRESRSRPARAYRSRRRRRLLVPGAIIVIALVLIMDGAFASSRSFAVPGGSSLAGMSVGQRVVAFANSQLGYTTDPSSSYCNKFSAYWGVGAQTCPGAESSEEWCADFAAWAWRKAGVPFSYGFGSDDINAAAASFYEWGVAHGTWHSAYGGYRPVAGDVAVYGLSTGSYLSAAHVAVVTGDPLGQRGPDVINGDGDRTGFSVVETGTDQLRADTGHGQGALLAGYVSPD
jgi:CHAP domain